MAIVQIEMIEKVKALAFNDQKVSVLLMYGSFIKNEGDQYSDIEFYLFYRHDFDHRAWVGQIRPLKFYFTNEFGTEVALFDNLIRGEFHFSPVEEITVVKSWEGLTSFEYADRMSLVDKDGCLKEVLTGISQDRPRHDYRDQIEWLAQSFLNNIILTRNVLRRGDLAHAQQCFQFVQKYLMWLIRLADAADKHWENPSKNFQAEVTAEHYAAYAACVPDVRPESLDRALTASVHLASKLFATVGVSEELTSILKTLN